MTSFGIAGVVGGPIAGLIMSGMDGVAPLRNWQWLFVLEGIPSVIAGIVVLGYLPDRPRQARWLSAAEQTALEAELEAEQRHGGKHASFAQALRQPALWLCTAAYFCIVGGNATLAFWMPSLVRELGVRGALDIGLLSAIPSRWAPWRWCSTARTPTRPASGACIAPAPRWSARRGSR